MVLIRVDASQNIGLGHLMRCITIAEYFRAKGVTVHFISKVEDCRKWIADKGFEATIIPTNASMNEEVQLIQTLSIERPINVILLDINNFQTFNSLELYDAYLNQLKQNGFFLAAFEDPHNCRHTGDVIIIPYLKSELQKTRKNQSAKYLLGLKYYVLKPSFIEAKTVLAKKEIENILISMGGSDHQNITITVLESIKNLPVKWHLTIVLGRMSLLTDADIKSVLNCFSGTYTIIRDASDMALLMSGADMAVINSGLTKYETLSMGLPSIVISNNAYHAELMEDFNEYEVVLHLGEISKLQSSQIADAMVSLANGFSKREQMSKDGKSLIDGLGIERIFSELAVSVDGLEKMHLN